MFQKCKKVTARTRVSRRTVSRILKEGENAKLVSQLQFHLHVTEAEVLHKKFSGCLEEKKKLRGLSPRANYTDRAAAAGRRI